MKKILLIDDDPVLTDVLSRFLDTLGYSSDRVHSAAEAIEATERNTYWGFFCDFRMPGMSGLELYEKIRIRDDFCAGRFVLLTGGILDAAQEQIMRDQRIFFCKKPFHFQNIVKTVSALEETSCGVSRSSC